MGALNPKLKTLNQDLDGCSAFPLLRELYLSFNEVSDLSACIGCASLEVLDLEGNSVCDLDQVAT